MRYFTIYGRITAESRTQTVAQMHTLGLL